MNITKEKLQAALLEWVNSWRAGECLPVEETLELSAEQQAAESADYLWETLEAMND